MNQENQEITPATAVSDKNFSHIKIFAFLVIVCIAVGSLFLIYRPEWLSLSILKKENIEDSNSVMQKPASRTDISERNIAFKEAELLILKDPVKALDKYKQALLVADTEEDKESINFRIAVATFATPNGARKGINLFKQIIKDESLTRTTRAYAVQFLVQQYMTTENQLYFDEIFKDEPFLSMYKNDDKSLAIRKLTEYGAEFNVRLPIIDARIASYLVDDLLKEKSVLVDSPEAEKLRVRIKQKIHDIAIGLDNLVGSPNIAQIPTVYTIKASLLGKLYIAGEKGFDSPDEVFQQAIDFSLLYKDNGVYNFAMFNKAIFLANAYGDAKKTEIESLMKEVYANKDTKSDRLISLLKNSSDQNARRHAEIVAVANIDPGFKEYLLSIGWNGGDFGV